MRDPKLLMEYWTALGIAVSNPERRNDAMWRASPLRWFLREAKESAAFMIRKRLKQTAVKP